MVTRSMTPSLVCHLRFRAATENLVRPVIAAMNPSGRNHAVALRTRTIYGQFAYRNGQGNIQRDREQSPLRSNVQHYKARTVSKVNF
jgi:hypothetical protein